MIPDTLQQDEFRFTKVQQGEKYPFEQDWTDTNNYKYNDPELVNHLNTGGNYGVVCGYGDLVVIDCDQTQVENAVEANLPDTFKVRSGSGGSHFYFIAEDIDDPIRMSDNEKGDLGDVQAEGKQAVGPNSLHPNGETYSVENDTDIAEVTKAEVRRALNGFVDDGAEQTKEEVENRASKHADGVEDVSINDVAYPVEPSRQGDEIQGGHPVHGSSTGMNFAVNTKTDTWHCFRHGTGGGPLMWVAVREGIISCSDAEPGALNGDKFIEVLDVLEEEYGVDVDRGNAEMEEYGYTDDRGNFKPNKLAKDIENDYDFVYSELEDVLYVYMDGYYQKKGERVIKEECNKRLGDEFRRNRVSNVVEAVITRPGISVEQKEFRPPENMINFRNGVYDLETGELKSHSPDRYFTHQIPWSYDEDATCSEVDTFFEDVVETSDEKQMLYELVGYSMLPSMPIEHAFMLVGQGQNGKTVFLNTLKKVVGEENVKDENLQQLEDNRFATHNLYQKMAVVSDDLPSDKLNDGGTLKGLTGGGRIRAEIKGGDTYEFKNYALPIFACNEVPETEDQSNGFFRRWTIIDFPFTFRHDPDPDNAYEKQLEPEMKLTERIHSDEQLKGLVAASVEALEQVWNNGRFTGQKSPDETRMKWNSYADPVLEFIQKYIAQGLTHNETERRNDSGGSFTDVEADMVAKQDLKALLTLYTESRSHRPPNTADISKRLNRDTEMYFTATRSTHPQFADSRIPVYRGLTWSDEFEELVDESDTPEQFLEELGVSNKAVLPRRIEHMILSDRDTGSMVLNAVRDLDEPQFEDIVDETGLPDNDVEAILEKMMDKGEVFNPKPGVYQTM